MREVDLLSVLVPLVHREIDDPAELEGALVDELELLPDLVRAWAGELGEFNSGSPATKNAASPALRPSARRIGLDPFRADVIGERPAPSNYLSTNKAHVGARVVSDTRSFVFPSLHQGSLHSGLCRYLIEKNVSEPRLALALRPRIHFGRRRVRLSATRCRDRPDLVLSASRGSRAGRPSKSRAT